MQRHNNRIADANILSASCAIKSITKNSYIKIRVILWDPRNARKTSQNCATQSPACTHKGIPLPGTAGRTIKIQESPERKQCVHTMRALISYWLVTAVSARNIIKYAHSRAHDCRHSAARSRIYNKIRSGCKHKRFCCVTTLMRTHRVHRSLLTLASPSISRVGARKIELLNAVRAVPSMCSDRKVCFPFQLQCNVQTYRHTRVRAYKNRDCTCLNYLGQVSYVKISGIHVRICSAVLLYLMVHERAFEARRSHSKRCLKAERVVERTAEMY